MTRLNILVVDDSEENRDFLCGILKKTEHTYSSAGNGQEAIELLKHNQFDLVFMDLNMPIMTGDQATRYIRRNMPFPKNRVKIIAITAYKYKEFFDDFHDVGFNDIITKPYTPQKVMNVINYQNIISAY